MSIVISFMHLKEFLQRWTPRRMIFCLAAGSLSLAACAGPQPAALGMVPVTGSQPGGPLQVAEYALVEQSTDNPTHAAFQERVPASVKAQRAGLWALNSPDALQAPNRDLDRFGYRLAVNPHAPFSAYALYQGQQLVQADIARFWPVSLKQGGAKDGGPADFVFAYETMSGEQHMINSAGLSAWPNAGTASVPPVYLDGKLAYVRFNEQQPADGWQIVSEDEELLYSGTASLVGAPPVQNLRTWGDQHWAMELDGHVLVDGQNLNEVHKYDESFHWNLIDQQPFYFYVKGGLTYLNYAGKDLPYAYDLVVHHEQGETAIFNPGSSERLVWFYALRDGLWYYVEVGHFE